MILAFVTSASSGVMMADASNLPDAGKMTAGADGTVEQMVLPQKLVVVKMETRIFT